MSSVSRVRDAFRSSRLTSFIARIREVDAIIVGTVFNNNMMHAMGRLLSADTTLSCH